MKRGPKRFFTHLSALAAFGAVTGVYFGIDNFNNTYVTESMLENEAALPEHQAYLNQEIQTLTTLARDYHRTEQTMSSFQARQERRAELQERFAAKAKNLAYSLYLDPRTTEKQFQDTVDLWKNTGLNTIISNTVTFDLARAQGKRLNECQGKMDTDLNTLDPNRFDFHANNVSACMTITDSDMDTEQVLMPVKLGFAGMFGLPFVIMILGMGMMANGAPIENYYSDPRESKPKTKTKMPKH